MQVGSGEIGVDSLTRGVARLLGHCSDQRSLAEAVGGLLSLHLKQPAWLPAEYQEPGETRYRQHVIYVAPCDRFSLVSLVWKPGQRTPIHDHVSWCVVGVYRGLEQATGYHLYDGADGQFLVPVRSQTIQPGQIDVLVPPDEDIHQVACAGDALTVSIHIYGANVRELGSSVNRRFDELAVRQNGPESLTSRNARDRLAWRNQ